MFCPQCSAAVQEGSAFCGACGARLAPQEEVVVPGLVHKAEPTILEDCEQRAREAADAFARAYGMKLGAIAAKRARLVGQLDAERAAIVQAANEESNAQLSRSFQVVTEAAAALAPEDTPSDDSSSEETPHSDGEDPSSSKKVAEYLRLGLLDIPQLAQCPVLVPFFGRGHVMVEGDLALCGPFIREVLWQAASGTSADDLDVVVYNPRVSSTLAPYAGLPSIRMIADSGELAKAVGDLKSEVNKLQSAMADPNANLIEYRKRNDVNLGRMRVLVLLDFPERLGADTAKDIEDLIERGPAFGMSLIVHFSPELDARLKQGDYSVKWFDDSRYAVKSERFAVDFEGVAHWARFSDLPVVVPSRDNAAIVSAVTGWSDKSANLSRARRNRIDLLPLKHPKDDWTQSSQKGIVLASIKKDGQTVHDVMLDDAHVHGILLGGTGSGKSNFILALMYGMSQRYSPAELVFFALDFKEGLSMATLAADDDEDGYLPHAALLGVNSDRKFGAEVLQEIIRECKERSERFKDAGVQKFSDYREKGYSMPRIVLVIDEFQVLFEGGDDIARQAGADIKTIASQGRSAGVHIILATQTLAGIAADTSFKKSSMLDLMRIRMSLTESLIDQIVEGEGNPAKKTHLDDYEVFINDNLGIEGSDYVALTPYVESDFVDNLQDEWTALQVQRDGYRVEPEIFDGNKLCTFADVAQELVSLRSMTSSGQLASVVLGKCVTLSGIRYSSVELKGNMAVIGPAKVQERSGGGFLASRRGASSVEPRGNADGSGASVVGIMQMAGISLAFQDPHAVFLVFDGMRPAVAESAHMRDWVDFMTGRMGADLRVVERDQMVPTLKALEEALSSPDGRPESNVYLLGFDLGGIPELTQDRLGSADKKLLSQVMRLGPMQGVHTVIWWSDVAGIKLNLGTVDASISFSASVLLDVAAESLPANIPREAGVARWRGQENRALVCGTGQDKGELIVPVVPCDTAGYESFAKRLVRG